MRLKDEYQPSQAPIPENDVEESVANSKVGKASSIPREQPAASVSKEKPQIKVKKYKV